MLISGVSAITDVEVEGAFVDIRYTDHDPNDTLYWQNVGIAVKNIGARMVNNWYLVDLTEPDTIYSDTTTVYENEQLFIERGLSINVSQVYQFGRIWAGQYYDNKNDGTDPWHDYYTVVANNNGVITSSIEYTDPNQPWMSGLRDVDVPGSFLNWIRSGTYVDMSEGNSSANDYNMSSQQYGASGKSQPWDPNENWEKIANRSWAPALLSSYHQQGSVLNPGPVALDALPGYYESFFKETTSIDIVFINLWRLCDVTCLFENN